MTSGVGLAHNQSMLLTDATRVIVPANGKIVVVDEGPMTPAVTLKANAEVVFACGWLVPINTEDGPAAVDCGAPAVGFDNGWTCADGHIHYTYGWEANG